MPQTKLRAGFAAVDITPDERHGLLGYGFRQQHLPAGNAGVIDPVTMRVLALIDATGKPAALVSIDTCVIKTKLARALRAAVAGKLETDPGRVLVATSHTHSSAYAQLKGDKAAPDKDVDISAGASGLAEEYAATLLEKAAEAAAMAGGKLHPVSVRAAHAPLGIGYNRRVQTAGGIRLCWNPLESPDLKPAQSPDPTCSVIVLREPHGPRQYVLWSAGAHATALGKTSRRVSGDWPALAGRMIEAGGSARHLFFPGACGEVHPWIATQEDPAQLEPIAAAASGLVRLLVQSGAGETSDDATIKIVEKTWKCGDLELDLAAWRIGPARILAAPTELFASLSARLRLQVRTPIFMATLTNGWTGYWPDERAFDEGGYEVGAAWGIKKGDGERLIEELATMNAALDDDA